MIVKTKAIVLSYIRFQEKSLIVKCYTASDGIKSYFVRSAFSNNKSNQKIAYFQPLSILEIVATHKNKGTLEYFKEIRLDTPYQNMYTNIYKSTIAVFIAEVLQHCIKEEEANKVLFEFLETSLILLDHTREIRNFHIAFLIELSKHLGFYPDTEAMHLPYFDLHNGTFVPYEGTRTLNAIQTQLFKSILETNFSNSNSLHHVQERQAAISLLMEYYEIHLLGFKLPNSIAVLKEVFA